MYKAKVFDTYYDLEKFLNYYSIKKSDIIHITSFSRGVALLYYTESEEK